MAENFNIYEVKQIALNLENDGFAFYMAMSSHTGSLKAKAIFLKLANDEKEHIKWINEMDIEEINVGSDADIVMINDYINNVIKSGVFPNPEKSPEVMATILKDSDGIRIGMNAESKSVKFFDQLHKNVTDQKGRDILARLRDQEVIHYNLLKDFLAEVNTMDDGAG